MTTRFPLTVNTTNTTIEELPSGIDLDLSGSDIANVGNISGNQITVTGNVSAANVSGTLLTGTLVTAAQPNVTSVGTLASLDVTGNVSAGNVSATDITGTTLGGTLTTGAQPNVTSVGTLASLDVTGNVSAGNVTATGSVDADDIKVDGTSIANAVQSTDVFQIVKITEAAYDNLDPPDANTLYLIEE